MTFGLWSASQSLVEERPGNQNLNQVKVPPASVTTVDQMRYASDGEAKNGFVLIPKGDGSCDHLSKRVSLPGPIQLEKGLYELGREEPADIVVPIPTVSSRHAMIRTEDGRVTVTDLNSTNGTYLNETELEPMKSTDVPVGAEVTFGDVFLAKFQLQSDNEGSNAAKEASAAGSAAA
ncbi:hypothetical protein WJX84_011809 [Apatococcus fuscideae]|uniref:FHA domain-containing protein n=1 Tax=Apatococcus fuscideae TaxID=2026836 RepID=A0AAW1SQQ0_9CHLO